MSVYDLFTYIDTGEWGEWGLWSNCSAVCNGGHQHRNRSCVSDGFSCEGDKDENRTCNLEPCPGKSPDEELRKLHVTEKIVLVSIRMRNRYKGMSRRKLS